MTPYFKSMTYNPPSHANTSLHACSQVGSSGTVGKHRFIHTTHIGDCECDFCIRRLITDLHCSRKAKILQDGEPFPNKSLSADPGRKVSE